MKLDWLVPLSAAVISVGIALCVFGLRIANPFDLTWFAGDVVVAQFGVQQYLDDPNHLFPVVSDRYAYPLEMPAALYDCFPFLAFLIKVSGLGADNSFQYFGPIFLIGIALQAVFSWLLIRDNSGKNSDFYLQISILAGVIFLTNTPTLYFRFFLSHMSLSLHWQIIATMWLFSISSRYDLTKNITNFCAISTISGFITPYSAVMVILIYLAFPVKLLFEKKLNLRTSLLCLIPIISAFIPMVIFNFYEFNASPVIPGTGYGSFSANFNTFLNPMSALFGSRFMGDLETSSYEQYEGFAYLGVGAISIIFGGLWLRLRHAEKSDVIIPLALISLVAFVLALSSTLSFGASSLEIPLPPPVYRLLEIFRSSGRFIWVPGYFLLFLGVVSLIRFLPARYACGALMLGGIIQVIDIAQPLRNMSQKFSQRFGADYFTDPAYAGLGRAHDTLIVLPAWQCQDQKLSNSDYDWQEQYGFPNLAMKNQMRTNSYYAGRSRVDHIRYHCTEYPAAFQKKPADVRSAYLLTAKMFSQLGKHVSATHACDFANGMFVCRGDKQPVGLSERAKSALAATNTGKVDTLPATEEKAP